MFSRAVSLESSETYLLTVKSVCVRMCVSTVAALLIATLKFFRFHKFRRISKIVKQNVLQAIVSHFNFWTTNPSPTGLGSLQIWLDTFLDPLQLTLHLDIGLVLVLCRFGLIHFWTSFISSSQSQLFI